MLKRPRGGLWLELKKSPASEKPIVELKAPLRIYLPLRQCDGDLPELIVGDGNRVLMGQPLAEVSGKYSCALHSPVSGTVECIKEYNHPVVGKSMMVVIENDGRDMPYKTPISKVNTVAEIISRVKFAGVVSSKGQGEPYFAVLERFAREKPETVVINAVEAEPFLCASQKILEEMPDDVSEGLALILKCSGAKRVFLAVSDDIPRTIVGEMVENAHLKGIEIAVAHISQKYPNGNEQFILRALFAHEMESAVKKGGQSPKICFVYPSDCINVSRAVVGGMPQLTRIITVAGDAVEKPQNLEVRIGTRVIDILNHTGLKFDPDRVVFGSAMTGVAIPSLDVPVTKSVGAVLALKTTRGKIAKSVCINCGKCVSVCPQGLLPNYIAMRAVKADFDALQGLHIDECIECGSCAYICPGRMPIVELIKNIKKAAK